MKLDRALQLELLKAMADCYPAALGNGEIHEVSKHPGFLANLKYLIDHGLVDGAMNQDLSGAWYWAALKASAKGMDFLADDGGLSAILGVVTIKIHDDTIKQLIKSRILESDLAEPEKKKYLDQLQELPAETTKHLVLKLVDLGLEKGQAAIATIGTFLDAMT